MVREYFAWRGGFPKDCGWAVDSSEEDTDDDSGTAPEDDVDEDFPTPEDEVLDEAPPIDDADEIPAPEDEEEERPEVEGPTIGVPLFASVPAYTCKRVHEDEGYPNFLKKARLQACTLEFIVDSDYDKEFKRGQFPMFQELPFKRSTRGLDQIELPVGCTDWEMAFNVAMEYVDCPLCFGYGECSTCGGRFD
jgi:hypothetical protein